MVFLLLAWTSEGVFPNWIHPDRIIHSPLWLYGLLITLRSVPCPSTTGDPPGCSVCLTRSPAGLLSPWGIQAMATCWGVEVEVASGDKHEQQRLDVPPQPSVYVLTTGSKHTFIVSLALSLFLPHFILYVSLGLSRSISVSWNLYDCLSHTHIQPSLSSGLVCAPPRPPHGHRNTKSPNCHDITSSVTVITLRAVHMPAAGCALYTCSLLKYLQLWGKGKLRLREDRELGRRHRAGGKTRSHTQALGPASPPKVASHCHFLRPTMEH